MQFSLIELSKRKRGKTNLPDKLQWDRRKWPATTTAAAFPRREEAQGVNDIETTAAGHPEGGHGLEVVIEMAAGELSGRAVTSHPITLVVGAMSSSHRRDHSPPSSLSVTSDSEDVRKRKSKREKDKHKDAKRSRERMDSESPSSDAESHRSRDKKKKKKKKKSDKEKKKRKKEKRAESSDSDSSADSVHRSAITGKKLKLKVKKTTDDRVRDVNRSQLLSHLNQIRDISDVSDGISNFAHGVVGDGAWTRPDDGSSSGNSAQGDSGASMMPGLEGVSVPDTIAKLFQKLSAASGVTGAILIATGLVFCFLGRRLFKPTLFLTGFFIGGTFLILNLLQKKFGNISDVIYVICILIAGLVVGGLCLCFFKLALLALGALLGLVIAQLILMAGVGNLVDGGTRTVIIVVLMLLTALLVLFTEHMVITLSTALTGATAVTLGIDVYVHTGLTVIITMILQYSLPPIKSIPPKAWGLAGGGLGLAILGIIVQMRVARGRKWRKEEAGVGAVVVGDRGVEGGGHGILHRHHHMHMPTHGTMEEEPISNGPTPLPPAFLPFRGGPTQAPHMAHRNVSPMGQSMLPAGPSGWNSRWDTLWNGRPDRRNLEMGSGWFGGGGRDMGEVKYRYV
ncbi:hypothetical protein HDV00_004956 [Rhizophlyctis rosea]|nr:hypothetical protein HDV00_004956 [Rhizophlyctis rosea]